jgi:ketohexokinase
VLAQHGHRVSFVGTRADDTHSQNLVAELAATGVDPQFCQVIPNSACPLSCILHNQQTGSRTIVHYRDLPEYDAAGFAAIPLPEYDWFHFEGRNLQQLPAMLEQVRRVRVDQPISIEIEKARPGIEQLFAYADVLFFSQAFARAQGYAQAQQLFEWVQGQAQDAILVCSWGAQGAFARQTDGAELHAAAQPVSDVCDSVGAGDTFNAGVIHGLLSGQTLPVALAYANRLAARKLGQIGFDRLVP